MKYHIVIFLKWIGIRIREVFQYIMPTLKRLYIIWSFIAYILIVLDVLYINGSDNYQTLSSTPHNPIYNLRVVLAIVCISTVILPWMVRVIISIKNLLLAEYNDFSYFVSTGGKRKRDHSRLPIFIPKIHWEDRIFKQIIEDDNRRVEQMLRAEADSNITDDLHTEVIQFNNQLEEYHDYEPLEFDPIENDSHKTQDKGEEQ